MAKLLLFCLHCVFVIIICGGQTNGFLARLRRRACGESEFQCKTGECISRDDLCDGFPHCIDKSDETKENCAQYNCPTYTFRCAYGACIDLSALCDGVKNCFDNSDEDSAVCKSTKKSERIVKSPTGAAASTSPSIKQCALPNQPQNGQWTINGQNSKLQPGNLVPTSIVLTYKCNTGYMSNEEYNICVDGKWLYDVQCQRTCPLITSTNSRNVNCELNGTLINCSRAVDGTIAKFNCAKFYEDSSPKIRYCEDGTWNRNIPKCSPVCGMKSVRALPLTLNSQPVQHGDYPWNAAIYRKEQDLYQLICAGTLINQKVIITAAHCVTNKINNTVRDKELYKIGVGKYYNKYQDTRDIEAQYSSVEKILVPEQYHGEIRHYMADIALIITEKTFDLSREVQPICLNLDGTLSPNSQEFGVTTGWGLTLNRTVSEDLNELQVAYIDRNKCARELPTEFAEKYFLADKACTSLPVKNFNLCLSMGGGLAFRDARQNRYFLHSIASISPQNDDLCPTEQYILHTEVSKYLNFIRPILTKYEH